MANTTWVLDPSHSELVFKVKHLMIANVKGEFRKFHVIVNGEDLFSSPSEVVIEAGSVFTNNEDRDAHLRSADFFDTGNWPSLIFRSTSLKKKEEDNYVLAGNLTIRDITKPVSLDVEFGGLNKDPWGNEKAGFSISGKINRKDWGLNWNAALETGGVLVSDEVKIQAEIQLIRKV